MAVFSAALASASAFFYDPASGAFTLGAMTLNGGNAVALTSGSTTAFATSAGLAAGALGLLGLAVVKIALLANLEGRSKRSAPVEELEAIDNYFATISAMDVDDCGKLLVCELETIPTEVSFRIGSQLAGLPDNFWLNSPILLSCLKNFSIYLDYSFRISIFLMLGNFVKK